MYTCVPVSSWPPLSLTCDEGLVVTEMVFVTGVDVVDALVVSWDDEDTTANGLVFDCGTGFCTTGLVVDSSLSFMDITYSSTIATTIHGRHDCLTRLVISSALIAASCEISDFLVTNNCCNLYTCMSTT